MQQIKIACDVKDTVPLEELVEFQGDLKSLAEQDFLALKREILETGFAFPILVWKSPEGQNCIVGGHQRAKVLSRLKSDGYEIPPIPVVFVAAESKQQAKRRVLQDISQYGKVETDGLAAFLRATAIPLEYIRDSIRLPEINLDKFEVEFQNGGAPSGDADEVPEAGPEPVTKLGDIYELGNHRLICGDSTDPAILGYLMEGKKAHMVWTDPPYNVAYEGKTKDALTIQNDQMSDGDFFGFLLRAFQAMLQHTEMGGAIYVAHADSEGFNFRGAMRDAGWLVKQCLIWNKNHMVMGRQDYHWKHEPILYGWAPGAAHNWYSDRRQVTVLDFDRPSRNGEHPTMKPVALIEYMLGNSSRPGDLVLDPFGGSGSTLMACEQTLRHARLCELDPRYCDVIVKRYENFSKQSAKLVRRL